MSHLHNAYDEWVVHSNTSIEYGRHFDMLLTKIKNNEMFSFIRIADGEYHLYKYNRSFDYAADTETINTTKLELDKIIKEGNKHNLIIAIQWGTRHDVEYKELIDRRLNHLKTYHASLFSWATVTGKMLQFFKQIQGKPVILVGPRYLKSLYHLSFIETLEDRSWINQDQIEELIENEIKKYKNPIIIYCCSLTGKLAAIKNYFKYGDTITQIDMGANYTPYVGVFCRPWHEGVYLQWKKS